MPRNFFVAAVSDLYVGLDVLKTTYATKDGHGSNVFAKNPTAFNAFIGYKLPRNFFVEAGYEWTKSKNRVAKVNAGEYFLGTELGGWMTTSSTIKKQLPYLGVGINYQIPQLSNTSLFALAGISKVKIKATYKVIGDIDDETPTQNSIDDSNRTFKKNKIAPMLKLGINHKFSQNIGIHFVGTWYKLKNVTLNKPLERPSSTSKIYLKNTYSVGVGASYYF